MGTIPWGGREPGTGIIHTSWRRRWQQLLLLLLLFFSSFLFFFWFLLLCFFSFFFSFSFFFLLFFVFVAAAPARLCACVRAYAAILCRCRYTINLSMPSISLHAQRTYSCTLSLTNGPCHRVGHHTTPRHHFSETTHCLT